MEDVIRHDPALVATTYAVRLYELLARHIPEVIELPLYFMFLPGAFFLLGRRWSPPLVIILLVALGELLLVNLKPFHARYHLFLAPFLGAAIGYACREIVRADWSPPARRGLTAALILMFVVAIGLATAKPYRFARHQIAELAELVPLARHEIAPGAAVVARKPHLAFHVGAEAVFLPALERMGELRDFLRRQAAEHPVYLLYGQAEQRWRPQYRAVETADLAPSWLEAVAQSEVPGQWVLYRYREP